MKNANEYVKDHIFEELTAGFIAQLVEHCSGIAEVMGLIPVQARIFSGFNFTSVLSCL